MTHADGRKAAEKTTERLSVNVTHLTGQTIRALAEARDVTITEVIRRAVAVLKLLEDEQARGTELQLVRKGEDVVRILHII